MFNGMSSRVRQIWVETNVINSIQFAQDFPDLGASQVVPVVKNQPANARNVRDVGLIPGSGRSPGERNGYPLQYCGRENPMDRGAWWATVHGVTI